MKAIVHIGTEKTGTTSIQRYLYLNRKKLRNAGFHFIQSAGETNNRALPAYCVADDKFDDFFRLEGITTLEQKEQFKESFIKVFEDELHSLPKSIHTVLISSEHFHSRIRTEDEMDNVYNLLSTYFDEIKIVCYLREQATTCTSYYSTHLKSGGIESFRKFLERCKPINNYYNYLGMLANWERCFGQEALDVSLFAKEHFLNRNLLDDFTAKIDPALVGKLNQNVELENESLTPAGQVLARIVNLVFPVKSELPEVATIRDRCKKLIADRFTGKGQQPDFATAEFIYECFRESNEQLRQKYFPEIVQLFPAPVELELPRNVIDEEFTEALQALVSMIRKNRTREFMPEVLARLWSAVSTCVTDVANVESVDFNLGPPGVVLTDRDAHLLKNVANSIEKKNPQAGLKLMTLAGKVKPENAAIQKKLTEYRDKGIQELNANSRPQYIFTYQTDEQPFNDQEVSKLNNRTVKWLKTLDMPAGSNIRFIRNTHNVRTNSEIERSASAVMGAYFVLYAESLDDALAIAITCPYLESGGTVEVSEIVSFW